MRRADHSAAVVVYEQRSILALLVLCYIGHSTTEPIMRRGITADVWIVCVYVVVPIHCIDPCAFQSNANMIGIWSFGKTILACPRQRINSIGYSIPRIIHLFLKEPFMFHAYSIVVAAGKECRAYEFPFSLAYARQCKHA